MRCLWTSLIVAFASVKPTTAATAAEWKSRSIYQVITDRYALPSGHSQSSACDVFQQTFCGGTWNAITANLDYIQSMGFTAIWISPVHKNYDGPRTAYGDAYHGYWVTDISQLNSRFGTSDDLKNLSGEVHRRGMLFMVDIVVNHVATTTITPTDYSPYYFKDPSQYHPYCPVNFGDTHSEQQCWLGDTKVALMDVNTENEEVISEYSDWIKNFVQQYNVDGLRLDAAKHIRGDFWPSFCGSAGVFCMGEVYEQDVGKAALWQFNPSQPTAASSATGGSGNDSVGMDSVLNFPLYWDLVDAFGITGQSNGTDGLLDLTVLQTKMTSIKSGFADSSVLGTFLENQDVPRWANISVDQQSLYNALTFLFMTDGIPIVYYGLEQGFSGGSDPANREALWPSGYVNSTGVQMITKLNKLRNWMIKIDGGQLLNGVQNKDQKQEVFHARNIRDDIDPGSLKPPTTRPRRGVAILKALMSMNAHDIGKRVDEGYEWQENEKLYKRDNETNPSNLGFIDSPAYVTGANKQVMAIVRDSVIGVVTNIGSPPQNVSFAVLTPYQRNVATTDIFTCIQYAVGSDGIVSVEYSKGGRPIVLVPSVYLSGSGICDGGDGTDSLVAQGSGNRAHSISEIIVFMAIIIGCLDWLM